ncbi:mucin-2-like [Cylas formicarius]|uniref:mucin-2-like n=1 Tax=Cylas formicarius TaxID=197179 RepID=UPI002958C991|nr:mucin-2-like [Cylas formicarius]
MKFYMSTFLGIFIAAAVSSLESSEETIRTPDPLCPYPSHNVTFYPDPNNCAHYFECYEGNKYSMECPPDLYWNTVSDSCDYLEYVDCTRAQTATTGKSTTPTTEGSWAPDPLCPYPSHNVTFYPNPNNCSQYYECYEGNKYLMDCPPDLYWNTVSDNCDYLENVNCGGSATKSSTSQSTSSTTTAVTKSSTNQPSSSTSSASPTTSRSTTASPADSVCQNKPDGTFVEDPNDCTIFYECNGGKGIAQHCPSGTYWNESILSCDNAANVQSSSPTCTSNKVEFYPDPQDCSSFYECVNGQISKHRCPDGQSWDPEFVACNFSHEVNCGSRPKEHYPNCPSEGVSYFPDLEDCSGFYICINGKTGHLTCPDQLSWSTDHEECLITENVDCGLRPSNTQQTTSTTTSTTSTTASTTSTSTTSSTTSTTTSTTSSTTSTSTSTTSSTTSTPTSTTSSTTAAPYPECPPNKVVFFPDPDDCNKFYECLNGQSSHRSCPSGQVWDPEIIGCSFNQDVNCTSLLKRSPECASDGISYFPDFENCSRFYECINGKVYHFVCIKDFNWDSENSRCLKTEFVRCGNRRIIL